MIPSPSRNISYNQKPTTVASSPDHMVINYTYQIPPPPSVVSVLGSCDGLLFVGLSGMWLYNLSTRKSKTVPNPTTCRPLDHGYPRRRYGFGYNTTDYQVVLIEQRYKQGREDYSLCQVYSLRDNSWRQVPVPHIIRNSYFRNDIGVFVNGAIHWVTRRISSPVRNSITAFDFATDEFLDLHIPDCQTRKREIWHLEVVVLGDCLCFICDYKGQSNRCIEGWKMKDYGVKESWTKLFEMIGDILMGTDILFDPSNVFAFLGSLYLYKSEDRSIVKMPFHPGTTYFAARYEESLVPLN